MDLTSAKQAAAAAVDDLADELLELSHRIHATPELCFEEHTAHAVLTDAIAAAGYPVTRGAYDLATAFESRIGSQGPTVAVVCEYDALPGIGHACGHNIIAAAGLGAGLAVAGLADELGGRLAIIGTPAEEGGGGKVFMIERGAFDGVDAAMMIHPAGRELTAMNVVAIQRLEVVYAGEAAHAAAAPHKGRNALDAAVLGYVNVAALRQHIRPDERIHGIFTDAGDKPNIVPERAAAEWYVRSPSLDGLEALKERVLACLAAGADAAGCTMTHRWIDPIYADMVDNAPLLAAYAENATTLGRRPEPPDDQSAVVGSTDMGNVSHVVPSIHPMIAVSPPDVAIHTPAFAAYAGGPEGDRAVIDGAKAMAMTVVDLWLRPELLAEAAEHWHHTA